MHPLKGDMKVRDEIKKEFEQREASAPAWWVPLLPAAACIGVALLTSRIELGGDTDDGA
jgi:hypothetical protein